MIPLTDRPANAPVFRLPGRSVTAGGFAADALRLAGMLPESRFAINLCAGRYAFAVGFAACLLRGQTNLLVSDRSPDGLRAMAGRFPGAYVLTDSGDALAGGVVVPPPGEDVASIPDLAADLVAAIVFTSGSTGSPAGHSKTWRALVERSRDAAIAFGLSAAEPVSLVGTVPPQHMYGFEATVLLPLHAPACSWCGPAFYPADILAAFAEAAAPRVLVTTPMQLRALLGTVSMARVARVISATAPLDTAMAAKAEQQWGTVVSEIFGATEVGSIASRRTTEGDLWTPYRQVMLQAGADAITVCAPGVTCTTLDDALELLPDGRFRMLGRRSDVVKLGGRRASLANLNRALAAVDGVVDGVFLPPAPGEHHAGARMIAVVVAPGQTNDTILAGLRGRIDPAFLPRRIVQVDRLPRNELGKLPLGALQALAS